MQHLQSLGCIKKEEFKQIYFLQQQRASETQVLKKRWWHLKFI